MENEFVHIFSQGSKGDESYILSTKEGLETLKLSIENALANNNSKVVLSTTDGQPFTLHISMLNKKELNNVKLPYSTSYGSDKRENVVEPSSLFYPKNIY